jgi:uncharacterized membrane protein YkvA (DUF1232 family)
MNRLPLLGRLLRFRHDLVLLWRGFWHPETPLHLKAAMIGVVVYLVSPLAVIPDILPLFGILDDVALLALAVGWIAARLPESVRNPSRFEREPPRRPRSVKTIEGTARRL